MGNLTVGKLIEILKRYPKNLEVWCVDDGNEYRITEQDINHWSYKDSLGFYDAITIGSDTGAIHKIKERTQI